MKNFSSDLLEYLQSDATVECFLADLFYIQLPSGYVLAATNAQTDLTWAGVTYKSILYGEWQKDAITTAVGTGSNSTRITVLANSTQYMPGTTTPLLQAIGRGLFGGAIVTIYTAYMAIAQYGNIIGIETDFVGQMGKIESLGRASCIFETNDLMYRLNIQMPRNLLQTGCRHTLFDAGCTLSAASYAESHTVAVGSTQLLFNLTVASGHAAPYFTQGFVTMLSGQNAGLSLMIKQQNSNSQIQIMTPFLLPVVVGDTMNLFPGCQKNLAYCEDVFSNQSHYAGTPYVANPETVL